MFDTFRKMFGKSSAGSTTPPPFRNQGLSPESQESHGSRTGSGLAGPASGSSVSTTGDTLKIPLSALLKSIPKELHGKISPTDPAQLYLSIITATVLEQLPRGGVRMTLGELRQSAPVGAFTNAPGFEEKLIDLPLDEILKQLGPERLQRRTQKKVELPGGSTDFFGRQGRDETAQPAPQTPAAQTIKADTAPPAKTVSSPVFPPLLAGGRAPVRPPATQPFPAAAPILAPPRRADPPPAAAPLSIPLRKETLTVLLAEIARSWPEAVRQEIKQTNLLQARCELPMAEVGNALRQGTVRFSWKQLRSWIPTVSSGTAASPNAELLLEIPLKLVAPLYMAKSRPLAGAKEAAAAATIPDLFSRKSDHPAPPEALPESLAEAPEPTPEAEIEAELEPEAELEQEASLPRGGGESLSLPLSTISQTWPPPVRKQVSYLNLADARLEIPLEAIETGLKVGRVDYQWKQICLWIKPTPPPSFSAEHGETRLELPLHIIAPLYLQYQPAAGRSKAREEIAIDFTGDSPSGSSSSSGRPPSGGIPATVNPSAVAVAPAAAGPATSAAASAPANAVCAESAVDLADIFHEPEKRSWTPNEIVYSTNLLPGVAGSLIALQDGLLVATCLPPQWSSETIAAFLPQIFGRMNQYSKELKLGDLEGVSFTIGTGTLQVYKAGSTFFAILSKPGETLPFAQLKLIGRELSRQTH